MDTKILDTSVNGAQIISSDTALVNGKKYALQLEIDNASGLNCEAYIEYSVRGVKWDKVNESVLTFTGSTSHTWDMATAVIRMRLTVQVFAGSADIKASINSKS